MKRLLLACAAVLLAATAYGANGDFLDKVTPAGGGYIARYKMLDEATAAAAGAWVDVRWAKGKKTFHVTGIGTGTVQVYCSLGTNAGIAPATTVDVTQMGGDITTNSVVTVEDACSWVRVEKSAAGDSTSTTVLLQADSDF